MSYRVTAPLVVAKDEKGADVYLYEGAPVPDNVTGEQLTRLAADGMIAGHSPGGSGDARPAQAEVKAAWVDFAVTRGADRGEAEAATKQDLVDRYGDDDG